MKECREILRLTSEITRKDRERKLLGWRLYSSAHRSIHSTRPVLAADPLSPDLGPLLPGISLAFVFTVRYRLITVPIKPAGHWLCRCCGPITRRRSWPW